MNSIPLVQARYTKAAQEKVAKALSASGSEELKSQGAVVDKLDQDYISSMAAAGATLVQIISEKIKPLFKLVTLHNIPEHSEGPPNQSIREVYAKVSAEMDEYRSGFEAKLKAEMAKFEELTR